jgi:Putative adhesin
LELKNYNGEITALNISGSVIATTYNGDIKITFDKITDGVPMSYITYNGNVDLTFPGITKASLKMKTQQGEIYTGFEMNITSSGLVQNKDSRSGTFKVSIDEWKRGDINGGGPEYTVKTNNGDIFIRKK